MIVFTIDELIYSYWNKFKSTQQTVINLSTFRETRKGES